MVTHRLPKDQWVFEAEVDFGPHPAQRNVIGDRPQLKGAASIIFSVTRSFCPREGRNNRRTLRRMNTSQTWRTVPSNAQQGQV